MLSLISSDKIKARHLPSTKRFIDDFCTVMENLEVLFVIYIQRSLKLKLNIRVMDDHAAFFNLGLTIEEGNFLVRYLINFPFQL